MISQWRRAWFSSVDRSGSRSGSGNRKTHPASRCSRRRNSPMTRLGKKTTTKTSIGRRTRRWRRSTFRPPRARRGSCWETGDSDRAGTSLAVAAWRGPFRTMEPQDQALALGRQHRRAPHRPLTRRPRRQSSMAKIPRSRKTRATSRHPTGKFVPKRPRRFTS